MPTHSNSLGVPRRRSPREIAGKLLTLAVLLAMLGLLLADGARYLGMLVPFSLERRMAIPYAVELPRTGKEAQALNALAEKIAIAQTLPHEIPVQVHVPDEEWVQAFATLGGHVLVYKGMLKEVKSEEELAAVLAHEIAHLKHRHPTAALGRRVNLALLLFPVAQGMAETIAAPSFGSGLRTAPHFTQDQEQEALIGVGESLSALYGHLGGAFDLGTTLRRLLAASPAKPPGLIGTHPSIERSGESLQLLAQERNWKLEEPSKLRRSLPAGIAPPLPAAVPQPLAPAAPEPAAVPR